MLNTGGRSLVGVAVAALLATATATVPVDGLATRRTAASTTVATPRPDPAATGGTTTPPAVLPMPAGAPSASTTEQGTAPSSPSAQPSPDPTPSPSPTPDPAAAALAAERVAAAAADAVLAAMTTEQKIGQLLVLQVYGSTVDASSSGNRQLHGTATARAALERWQPGGVILFRAGTDNLRDPEQVRRLTEELHAATSVPVLVAIDQEHGPIDRLPAPATLLPSLMAVAAGGTDTARAAAALTATELAAVGIDVNFAPVADVQTNPDNPVIGTRSAGSDPQLVADTVVAQLEGYAGTGVAPTVKHFPGHGDTAVDSHVSLPRIDHDRERLEEVELAPFRAAVDAGVPLVMTGHLQVSSLDPDGTPATLSRPIVTDLLRTELGFDGVVVTDALNMAAVRRFGGAGELAVRALEAGADLLLMPPDTAAAVAGIRDAVASGRLTTDRLDASVRRVLLLKARLGRLPGLDPAATPVEPAPTHGPAPSLVGTDAARDAAITVATRGLTLLRGGCLGAPAGPVAVVAPRGTPAAGAATEELTALGVDATLVETRRSPGGTDRRAASAAAAPAALTIVWADADAESWRRLVAEVDADNTVLTVVTDLPTAAARTAGDSVLSAYGDAAVQGTALARMLVAGRAPTGRLSVDVPDVGAAGAWIGCPYPVSAPSPAAD